MIAYLLEHLELLELDHPLLEADQARQEEGPGNHAPQREHDVGDGRDEERAELAPGDGEGVHARQPPRSRRPRPGAGRV